MSQGLLSKVQILKDRAKALALTRHFFDQKGLFEVDIPVLSTEVAVDCYIDLVEATANGRPCFLASSPELKMKRLLAEEVGDIYFLGHVFRDNEIGFEHQIEFTMLEWYRKECSLAQLIDEVIEYLSLFLGHYPVEKFNYKDLIKTYGGSMEDASFAFDIQPQLGKNCYTVIDGFPKSMAALSEIELIKGENIARRFEVFFQGKELANGYKECLNANENKKRFLKENEKRCSLGKKKYPIDGSFLRALEKNIPPYVGVSVGFDRVMMLKNATQTISEVLPFSWEKLWK